MMLQMNFNKALVALFFLVLSNFISAQGTVKILTRPKDYDRPTGKILDAHTAKKGELFTVLSDRDENPLYDEPVKDKPNGKKLRFLQPLVVIAEEGAFFKVAEYEEGNIVKNTIKNPKILGFAEKSKLLLWKNAIRNQQGFVIKALSVVKDGNVLVNPKRFIDNGNNIVCYSTPSINQKYVRKDAEVRIFKFLFVCKEDKEANMVLLAKSSKFSIETSTRILGWVPNDIVQIWEDRLCLEPNFDKDAIDERKLKNIYPALNISLDGAKNYKRSPKSTDSLGLISLASESTEKWIPAKKRLPIFNYDKTLKIAETGYFTNILNSSGETVIQDSIWNKLVESLTNRKLLLRNINVVFVIDGGAAMSPYMGSITNAIRSLNRDLTADRKDIYKVEYGVVIYRNAEDKSCPDKGDISVSKFNLSGEFEDAVAFVEAQKTITGCNDAVVPKALSNGIYEGLKMFDTRLGINESNYIILIGGAADAPAPAAKNVKPSGVSQQELVKLYSKVGANMFVFQNRKIAHPAYLSFQPKLVELMKKGNEEMLTMASEIKVQNQTVSPIEWEQKESAGYFSFKTVENDKFVKYGEISWPSTGGSLDEAMFVTEMDGFMKRITTRLQKELENIIPDVQNGPVLTNSMRVLLAGLKTKVSEKDIVQAFSGQNYQFFGRCYAPMAVEGLSKEIFQRVLFFTDDELSDLAQTLDVLAVSLDDIEQTRIQLKNTLIEIAASYIGKNEAKDISLDALLTTVIGKEPKNRIFYSIKSIEDIGDAKIVKDEQIKEIAKQFASKARQIKEVKADDSYRCKEDIDLVYYWVPEKFLP